MRDDVFRALQEEAVDWRYKGIPPTDSRITLATLNEQGWNVRDGDLLMPLMVLRESSLAHNIDVMAQYCSDAGVLLAPHGKTHMAPQILQLQIAAGAWGVTVASVSQAIVYRSFGFDRFLLANELIEPTALRWVSKELSEDPDFRFFCMVDSLLGIRIMDSVLRKVGARRPVRVLVELGQQWGRTGVRGIADAVELADAVAATDHLELAGVGGFEGLIRRETSAETVSAVDDFLLETRSLVILLADSGRFGHLDEIVVTAGGSAFFDRVVAHLGNFDLDTPVSTILRSGCYVSHDCEMYEELSPLAGRGDSDSDRRLQPAFELWGSVWSRPQPGLAIVGFGKRDAAYDYLLPTPLRVVPQDRSADRHVRGRFEVAALNDQHAYVHIPSDDPLEVGDLIVCGISHPCAAFDKWSLIPLINDEFTVIGGIRTFF